MCVSLIVHGLNGLCASPTAKDYKKKMSLWGIQQHTLVRGSKTSGFFLR